MAVEIERKFLVIGNAWRQPSPTHICQGYLNRDKERTVRIRIACEDAWIAVKGVTAGTTRLEFEYRIPLPDAERLLALCDGPVIEKHRHVLEYTGTQWEIDEFRGANAGLVVAEVELVREDQSFEQPPWLGEEITQDPRYFNSNLAAFPFSSWPSSRR